MRSRSSNRSRKHARLPPWTWPVCVAGGIVTYFVAGNLLQGERFISDLWELLFDYTESVVSSDAERIAPYVLLFIPAVLGALGTREMLRIVFDGIRDGHSPASICKNIALYLGSLLMLLIAAFFFGNTRTRH
jgi:hypothetical protein